MPSNNINTQVWLNLNSGTPDGVGPGSDDQRVLDVERAINLGINVYEETGGLTFNGGGSIKGGKTAYDVGTGFWLGGVPDDYAFKVAIGNPNANTFNFDGEFIDSQMRNLELTGWLRGPSTFTIDPATHGDDTGTVVIAGNLQVDGTTTTINSTVVEIDDVAVLLAAEATTASLANNGGIIVGTFTNNPFILYRNSFDAWEVNKDWTPNVNDTHDLGNTTKKWRNLWLSNNADIEGNLIVDGNVDLGSTNTNTITMTGRVDSSIIPLTDKTYDLGTSALRWRDLYADDGDFSGNLDTDGNSSVGGNSSVTGDSSVGGNASVGGTLTSTGDVSAPNMASDLTATTNSTGNADFDINLVAQNTNVLGTVSLKAGSNISLSESNDIITITSTQVQSDWTQTNSSDPAFIKNKPYLADDLSASVNSTTNNIDIELVNSNSQILGTVSFDAGNNITLTEANDVITIAATATPVQSNWNETNTSSLAFIQNKPTIPAAPVQSNWTETNTSSLAFIQNKPYLANDLRASVNATTNNIDIELVNSNSQILGTVSLDAGSNITLSEANDVITISSSQAQTQSDWNETNTSSAAFIQNKPTIPAAPVQSNWTETNTSSLAFIQNKPTIPTTIASLTDTTITSVQNGDILKYNSTSNKWENVQDSVVQYSVSPAPCPHYYIDIVEKGDLVTVQAALHIANETGTGTWTSTIQAPSGGSVPQPANTIAVGTAMTTSSSSASGYKTYVAQIDQSGVIKLRSTSSPGSGFATVADVKSNSADYLFINITFIK